MRLESDRKRRLITEKTKTFTSSWRLCIDLGKIICKKKKRLQRHSFVEKADVSTQKWERRPRGGRRSILVQIEKRNEKFRSSAMEASWMGNIHVLCHSNRDSKHAKTIVEIFFTSDRFKDTLFLHWSNLAYFKLKKIFYHTWSSQHCKSVIEHGLWAASQFSALNPQELDSKWKTENYRGSPSVPRKVMYKHSYRPEEDCVSCLSTWRRRKNRELHILL